LTNGTVYYWRVSASDSGRTSPYSAAWSFTTIVAGAGPAAPTLLSPADGSSEISTSPMLTWRAEPGATSYQVQISTSSAFSTIVVDQSGIANTSYSAGSLTNGTVYYWRVSASDSGRTSPYSAAWSFTTIVALTAQQEFRRPLP
ncbi:MAG: Fibronectin type domain protein, partial [Bacteroidetes bacterium]|nr:Fibronectin type domain protein [Bacteroidota bacterium]